MTGMETIRSGTSGAPTVAFAHGLEDAWTSWLPLAECLDPVWRLLALDLPWRPGGDYRWRGQASPGHWLSRGLDLVDTVPDVLVAHSYGANAALELLCSAGPPPARAVVLICPLYRIPDQPVTWRMFDRSRSTFVQHIGDGLRLRMGARLDATDPEVLAAMTDLALDRVGPLGFVAAFEQFVASGDLELGRVAAPTLVLAGGADPTVSAAEALALAAGIPGAGVRIRDEYDHFCHVRDAAGVAAHVADLVEAARTTIEPAGESR